MADRLIKTIDNRGREITTIETDTPVCDFCCNRNKAVHWYFDVPDAEMDTIGAAPLGSTNVVLRQGKAVVNTTERITLSSIGGRWAACDDCRKTVEDRLVIPLALVATAQYILNNQILVRNDEVFIRLYTQIKNVQYRGFWSQWNGLPAQRWTKEQ